MIRSIYFHNPTPDGFEKIIMKLYSNNYKFLNIQDLINKIQSKDFIGKNVIVTLDDGWNGNLKLIPIIEKYNVPITIFVSVEPLHSGNFWWEYVLKDRGYDKMFDFKTLQYKDFYSQLSQIKEKIGQIERSAMSVEEIKKLSKHPLISIQSHTINHPILTNVPDDILDIELSESKRQLEEITEKEVFAFSYPNGSLSEREINAAKRYYKMAFTTEQKNISINANPYLLPRYALTGDYFRDLLKMYGVWKIIKKIIKN